MFVLVFSLLIVLMILSLVLTKVNQVYASPVLSIFNRWLRWFIIAGSLADICVFFDFFNRSFEILFIVFFVTWFLIDTIFRWLMIRAISVSPLPLFPRFKVNRSGEEWPVQRRFLNLRDTLREKGFVLSESLRAEVATRYFVRVSVYQNPQTNLRLQVSFLPQPVGNFSICFQLSTLCANGTRIVTDNHYLPFAGFYPSSWQLERKPNTRGFTQLLRIHEQRILKSGQIACEWNVDPLEDLNSQQCELERLNLELGFLLPYSEHDEHGRISYEGRFRVWKEMLSLNYFGRAAKYN